MTMDRAVPDRAEVRRDRWVAALVFVLLLVVHHSNVTVIEEGDVVPNVNLPFTLLAHGKLSFGPNEFPEMFHWKTAAPMKETDDLYFLRWSQVIDGKPASEWKESGHITFGRSRYYIAPTRLEGAYVSTFGPVPGLVMVPVAAVLRAIDARVVEKPLLKHSLSKLHGSLAVAGAAVLVLLVARRFTSRRRALLLALAYGLGTCAWAVSSQAAWQQTFNAFFLALGTAFLVRGPEGRANAALAGAAYATAFATRPTSLLAVVAVGGYLAWKHRSSLLAFCVGAAPPVMAIALYNFHYFGTPISFGQEVVGPVVALEKTESPDLWQTPFFHGLAGLMASPSRGLLWFTPFLVAAFWGMVRIWRRPECAPLRPLTVVALGLMAVQCKWFDWWGGWTFGYRPWLDVVPLLVIFIAPVVDSTLSRRFGAVVAGVALAWSVFVQFLGAFSYDRSWNDRTLYVVRVPRTPKPLAYFTEEQAKAAAVALTGTYIGPTFCNIDKKPCRYRLWDLDESIIWYHFEHFAFTRARRLPTGWKELGK